MVLIRRNFQVYYFGDRVEQGRWKGRIKDYRLKDSLTLVGLSLEKMNKN